MTAYYNENDPFAAAWLRELIKMGHIAHGVVDERDIRDINPAELAGYTQCHFFAGIGVWSYALRRAGWPDDRPVWTGSCPCQPFSAAGRGGGVTDERHLWPHWFHLIQHGKPDGVPVFGEQVASKDGLGWLDLVQTDLEGAGYACWPVDLCAAGIGAPHIRQRLFFVAEWLGNTERKGLEGHTWDEDGSTGRTEPSGSATETGGDGGMAQSNQQQRNRSGSTGAAGRTELADCGAVGGMADTRSIGRKRGPDAERPDGENATERGEGAPNAECNGESSGLADADRESAGRNSRGAYGPQTSDGAENSINHRPADDGRDSRPGPTNGLWADADWLYCRDGKWRPVRSGTSPLVNGAAARVGRLRGYGNAINAEVAAAFIGAYVAVKQAWSTVEEGE